MEQSNVMCEKLMAEFAENYIGKLFYFCLKKTGNSYEAEDLTSDISLNILQTLKGGTVPANFHAWVWQIARNRYSVWADKKHRCAKAVASEDIGDFEIEDNSLSTLDTMIHREELALLRRELAFISSDYRNIVVAYYIDNKRVADIATSLDLPQGTVMSKLHRARKILKEGMNMAREFGKLSYSPENMDFMANGMFGKDREPWKYLERLICKNILLAAYRNPSTAEELAIEVGVALPYVEEEVKNLVDATLMKKNDNKYETNFFIVSAEAQGKIYAHLDGISSSLTKAIIDVVEFETQWLLENCPGWNAGYQPYEDMKWSLLMTKVETVSNAVISKVTTDESSENKNIGSWGHTIRPNGGEWDVLGMEEYVGEKNTAVGLHGCISTPEERELENIEFRHFRFAYKNLWYETPAFIPHSAGKALKDLALGNHNDIAPATLKYLEKHGYIRKTDEGYIPAICVLFRDKAKLSPTVREKYNDLQSRAEDIAMKHYNFCKKLIYQEIPDFLKDDKFQIDHACVNIASMRGAVLEEALRTGYITYKDNDERRMLGAFLII